MNIQVVDLAIIGGGPAGLAAAISAKKSGIDNLILLERESELGGILNQCIHNGFGLHTFQEELTGPEYAVRFIDEAAALGIPHALQTTVIHIEQMHDPVDKSSSSINLKDNSKYITAVNPQDGLFQIKAKAVILAMGCRERPCGTLRIPGYNPAGIFSAGTAQKLVNLEGYLPGREVVILGSGDIGLIMARRMTLEGAKVKLVAELQPFSGGLKRNIVQCLDDYDIPLKLSHTVTEIRGKSRLESVIISEVDKNFKPIPGTETEYSCDTLLLSVGLIPENELSKQIGVQLDRKTNGPVVNAQLETNVSGVFACGNVLHVHDLVDYVSEEASSAGIHAANYIQNTLAYSGSEIPIIVKGAARYTVPMTVNPAQMAPKITVRFRVGEIIRNGYVNVYVGDKRILHKKRPILAPGEMEQISLSQSDLITKASTVSQITIEAVAVADINP